VRRRIRSRVDALGAGVRANAARLTAATALVAVLLGLGLFFAEMHRPADWLWAATTAMLLVPLTFSVLRSLLRRDVGVERSRSSRWRARSLWASTWRVLWWR
jgi:hypothetical protein